MDTLNDQIAMMSMMLGRHCRDLSFSGRRGRYEYHAGIGHRAYQGNRYQEGSGSQKRVILQQFVIEAAVTSTIGGLAGILLGSLASVGIGMLMGIDAPPTVSAVLVSFSVSVGIGLVFGYMPASRAAGLNPIDALRSE